MALINYSFILTAVEEIEQAAERLTASDFDRLASLVSARYHDLWKLQMDEDGASGRLDFLFNEAAAERKAGSLQNWPADSDEK